MLELKCDCPYCQQPMKVHLQNLSPHGCHYMRPPYNIPRPSNYEGYLFTCSNGHAGITISATEYYFRQIAGYENYKREWDSYDGPLLHGHKPFNVNHVGFDGTAKLDWISMGYELCKGKYVSFTASPGETPYIYVYYWSNPYMDQFRIDCTEEWLSWSPDKIIEMMKITMEEHKADFDKHFEGCEEWDD